MDIPATTRPSSNGLGARARHGHKSASTQSEAMVTWPKVNRRWIDGARNAPATPPTLPMEKINPMTAGDAC